MKKFSLLVLGVALVAFMSSCTRQRTVTAPNEKIFRKAWEAKIPAIDPHNSSDVYSAQTEALTYETLYQYHYLKRPYELQPLLAEALPAMSKDKKTLTIKFKKGIHFQDDPCFATNNGKGRELVAQDFIYSMERIAGPKSSSPAFSSFEHRIVGIDDFHAGKSKSIAGIKLIDPYTIEIHLTQALPRFSYNFSDIHTAVLAKECVEKYGDDIARHAVGTGPYMIKEFDGASKVVAVRNPNYTTIAYPTEGSPGDKEKGLLEDAAKPLPLTDKVVYEVLIEDQPTWLKFLTGELEVSRIPKDNFGSALPGGKLSPELAQRGVQHLRQARGDVTVQIFNMEDPVWGKKKELRQAFALALDVPKIIEVQYASQAMQAESILDPNLYGYDPNYRSPWHTRNIQKAKELIAKAGYPDGKGLPSLQMVTTSGATARLLDELMTRQLAEAGITLQPDVVTWPELDKKVREHHFTSVGLGYASDMPDADTALVLLHSRGIANGVNAAGYKNAEFDKLTDEVEAMENGPERLAKIRRAIEIINDELPMVPMVHRIGNQLVQPWVKNHVYTDEMFVGSFMKYQKVVPSTVQ